MPDQVMLFRCCKGLDEEKLVVTQTEQDGVAFAFWVRLKRIDISDSGWGNMTSHSSDMQFGSPPGLMVPPEAAGGSHGWGGFVEIHLVNQCLFLTQMALLIVT
uniref:Uncharacterized protein n=1 Tax=Micrurus corallinus TaxID=54390 RepID=A0A2D4GQA9_MICCO